MTWQLIIGDSVRFESVERAPHAIGIHANLPNNSGFRDHVDTQTIFLLDFHADEILSLSWACQLHRKPK